MSSRKIGIMVALAVVIIGIFVASAWHVSQNQNNSQDEKANEWFSGNDIIAHALGGIDGHDYTNSKEAFIYNYEQGDRIFEVDFTETTDGEVVCAYNWRNERQEGIDGDHEPDLEKFLSVPIYGQYTPMSLAQLLDLLEQYPDAYAVTDIKRQEMKDVSRQFQLIVDTAKKENKEAVLDRFIIQFYQEDQLQEIREIYPFQNYIFTLYEKYEDKEQLTQKDFKKVASFCKENGVDVITMWDYWWNADFEKTKEKYGLEVYVHTVNDVKTAVDCMNSGVDGIYTDYITPGDLQNAQEK